MGPVDRWRAPAAPTAGEDRRSPPRPGGGHRGERRRGVALRRQRVGGTLHTAMRSGPQPEERTTGPGSPRAARGPSGWCVFVCRHKRLVSMCAPPRTRARRCGGQWSRERRVARTIPTCSCRRIIRSPGRDSGYMLVLSTSKACPAAEHERTLTNERKVEVLW